VNKALYLLPEECVDFSTFLKYLHFLEDLTGAKYISTYESAVLTYKHVNRSIIHKSWHRGDCLSLSIVGEGNEHYSPAPVIKFKDWYCPLELELGSEIEDIVPETEF